MVEVVRAGGESVLLAFAEHELQDPGEVAPVLAGVVDAYDLGGLGGTWRRRRRGW